MNETPNKLLEGKRSQALERKLGKLIDFAGGHALRDRCDLAEEELTWDEQNGTRGNPALELLLEVCPRASHSRGGKTAVVVNGFGFEPLISCNIPKLTDSRINRSNDIDSLSLATGTKPNILGLVPFKKSLE